MREKIAAYKPFASILVGFLIGLAVSACAAGSPGHPRAMDLTRKIETSQLPLPEKGFRVVSWPEPRLLIMTILQDLGSMEQETGLHVYDVQTGMSKEIPFKGLDQCNATRYGQANRLQDGTVAVNFECVQLMGRRFGILFWHAESEEFEVVFEFPIGFLATDFSFSPDKTNWVQESKGDGIFNELYHFSLDGEQERVFSQFQRAGAPAVSPSGDSLVFAASLEGAQLSLNPFSGLGDLAGAMYAPWNIYLQDQISGDLRLVFSDVQVPLSIKWSPTGDLLAMAALYDEERGIWLFDSSGTWIARIWPETASFEWSPDGSQLLINQRGTEDAAMRSAPATIIDLNLIDELDEYRD